jgi:hypothetical protein
MLHHVSLEIHPDQVERSAEFWGALGFHEVPAPAPIARYVTWLERGTTQIHLIQTAAPTVPAVGHTAVVTPDIESTLRGLQEAGFEVERKRELWGEPRAGTVAPGGHRVELMAAPPASSD